MIKVKGVQDIVIKYGYKLCLLIVLGIITYGCNNQSSLNLNKLTIGVVSYGEGIVSLSNYERLQQYLARKTNSIVELEPTYNELQALEQIQRKNWSIVFAPPGLAAIAIGQELYTPIFPLEKISNLERSVIVVKADSDIGKLGDLSNQTIALGKRGSAASYYLPLYDLYGLTLAKVIFASTPKQILQLISEGKVKSGALAEYEYERHHKDFPNTKFRILHKSRWIPAGVVLLSPDIESNQQEQIKTIMIEAPTDIAADAGYIPTFQVPDYQEFIKLVNKVQPLEEQVRQTPATLIIQQEERESSEN
ncbi:MAG: PhnD/SsuA/transferrin family substrate-binding protein [Xenococcaceae cyanobacterium MO_188.B29]|nr:PhnD/SsuA/transferrin family substrate-binding protein [Xenococcaceae cyanobacterium MO_188.B29]